MGILSLMKPKDLTAKAEEIAADMKARGVVVKELRQEAEALALNGMEEGDRRPWWKAQIVHLQAQLEATRVGVTYYSTLAEGVRARYAEAQVALLEVEDDLARDLGYASRAELGVSEKQAWPKWIQATKRIWATSSNSFNDSIRTSEEGCDKIEGQINALEDKITGDTKKRKWAADQAAHRATEDPQTAAEYLERTRKFR